MSSFHGLLPFLDSSKSFFSIFPFSGITVFEAAIMANKQKVRTKPLPNLAQFLQLQFLIKIYRTGGFIVRLFPFGVLTSRKKPEKPF